MDFQVGYALLPEISLAAGLHFVRVSRFLFYKNRFPCSSIVSELNSRLVKVEMAV